MANVLPFRTFRHGPPHASGWRIKPSALGACIVAGLVVMVALLAKQTQDQVGTQEKRQPGVVVIHNGALHSKDTFRPIDRSPPQAANRIRVTVVDGDSLRSSAGDIRLVGIDAVELRQTCRYADGRSWACGRAARDRLSSLVFDGTVSCRLQGRDRYGRTLATCAGGNVADIGEAMVREGYALNAFEGHYHAAETLARAERRGIWQGFFERPQEWRRIHPRGKAT